MAGNIISLTLQQWRGHFFSTPLNISYQDLVLLRKRAKEIIEKHSSEERDYEWAEGYTPNHSEVNEQGFGFDSYFNTTIGEKYKIHLSLGTLEDCDCPLDSDYQNGIMELMDTINANVRKNIDEDLSKKEMR